MEIFKSPYHLSFRAVPYSQGDPIKIKKTKFQCIPITWKATQALGCGNVQRHTIGPGIPDGPLGPAGPKSPYETGRKVATLNI